MLRDIVKAGPLIPRSARSVGAAQEGARHHRGGFSLRMIHNEAAGLYRMCFTMAVQDGVITPEEKRTLDWLQSEAGLSDGEVEPYRKRLRDIERLAEYRQGKLPSVKTRGGSCLKGAELCHWDGACPTGTRPPRVPSSCTGN